MELLQKDKKKKQQVDNVLKHRAGVRFKDWHM